MFCHKYVYIVLIHFYFSFSLNYFIQIKVLVNGNNQRFNFNPDIYILFQLLLMISVQVSESHTAAAQSHDQSCCSLVHPERSGLHGLRGRPSAGVPAGGTGRGGAFSAPEGPGHFLRGHSAVLQEDPQEDAWDGRPWNTGRAHLPASGTETHHY